MSAISKQILEIKKQNNRSGTVKDNNPDPRILRFDQAHQSDQLPASTAGVPLFTWNRFFALVLLVPCLPVMAFFMILTRITSRGPALYKQKRVGLHGKIFTLYKIRSMRIDAETNSGAVWARAKDPRITQLGNFLRWSHLDELPQLFNVLKGEMSFIGPRPERPEFVKDFLQKIERYDERLDSAPGITGLAQVCLPADNPDAGLGTVIDKLSLEIAFQEQKQNHALIGPRIIAATLLKMIGVPRKRYTNWLALNKITPVMIQLIDTESKRRIAA